MTWLNNSGVHRPDWHLKHAFAFHFAELMPLANKGRQRGFEIKIIPQRMDIRPIIVESAAARIGMANELQTEKILNLALLPIYSVNGVGERDELRQFRGHRHAQNDKSTRAIERENVIDIENTVLPAGVIGEQADQPCVP